ncbi:MAG: type II secretion system F family protein [Gammaproteobacteria bacterium]|nr:type II secretion system F family protein [Gammaproteobacteria bacterium]
MLQKLQFTRKQQQALLEDLTSLVEDGVSANAAVDTMCKIVTGIQLTVVNDLSKAIAEGKTLADGMRRWFQPAIVEIVRAGEASGTLPKALRAAVDSYAQQMDALTVVVQSMLYPFIVVNLALFMTVMIKNTVLENFKEIKPVLEWPSIGQNLYALGSFVEHGWYLLLIVLVGVVCLSVYILKNNTGRSRYLIDRLPLLMLYRRAVAARFMETLGLLITNGVVLKKALMTLQNGACPYLAWHLFKMEYRLSGGKENIADVLDTDLLSEHDLIRLKIVAVGKSFEQALVSLGRRAYRQNVNTIKLTARISGALLLVASAMIAATVVIGIYSVGSVIAT